MLNAFTYPTWNPVNKANEVEPFPILTTTRVTEADPERWGDKDQSW